MNVCNHGPVANTKWVPRHLCLDKSSVPSLHYYEPFITSQVHGGRLQNTRVSPSEAVYFCHATNVVQRRFGCLLLFCCTAIVQWISHRDDSVVCCRSSIRLWPSCQESSAETILRPAIVLLFWSTAPAIVPPTHTEMILCSALIQAYLYGCHDCLSSQQECHLTSGVLALPQCFDIRCTSWLFFQSISQVSHATS